MALALVLVVGAAACGSAGESDSSAAPIGPPTEMGHFSVQGGIDYVAVRNAEPGAAVQLVSPSGAPLTRGTADRFGSMLFRYLTPGAGYTVREALPGAVAGSPGIKVLDFADNPPFSFYQHLKPLVSGYQYLTTRDGTTLAITVRPPDGKTLDQGPFPTLINMSGYADADPTNPPPMSEIAGALGFATVSVNERGTGCSGGVNGLFDEIWTADGYDVVEDVAAQKWASAVGLTGISFPGITQLFTAGDRPPHLAAITPMSVIADVYRSPGYPGGIYNNGFTESWLTDRRNDARPAPEDGQGYAIARVKAGDKECLANQDLRLQTIDPIQLANSTPFRDPSLSDVRSPINWVGKIKVPTLLMGAWQDEQVGSDFGNLFDRLPDRSDVKVVASNGVHSSPVEPRQLSEWLEFVDIYVAHKIPDLAPLENIYNVIAPQIQGGDTAIGKFPTNPYAHDTSLAQARAQFEAQPRFTFLFDNGGEAATPGVPGGGFQRGYSAWPPTQAIDTRMYFGPDGSMGPAVPTTGHDVSDHYFPTISARPMQTLPGTDQGSSWELLPAYDWRPLVANTAVGYISKPLTSDTAMIGTGSVDLWLKANTPDTDVQVSLTDVRPDGTEVYVQSGWLRVSHRKLDPKMTTTVNPWPTNLASDAEPIPAGKYVSARVAIFPVAYVFRAGDRIRISIEAPGGDRTRWDFDTDPPPPSAQVWIGRSAADPSSIDLPLVDNFDATDPVPACPGLRGEPCRTYLPASNGG